MRTILRSKSIFLIYVVVVLLLVILPLNSAGELNDITILHLRGDYFFHALMFVPWMLFPPIIKVKFLLWMMYGLFFAAASEGIQYVLPYRAFNVNDLLANVMGIILGAGLLLLSTLVTQVLRDYVSKRPSD